VSVSGDAHDRQERAARNQSLFREINERIEDPNESFGIVLPVGDWIRECANDTCVERVEMSADEYEAVRKNGKRFFVAPTKEHVWPDVELVIGRNERYWIAEKVGQAATMAKAADPRADEDDALPLHTEVAMGLRRILCFVLGHQPGSPTTVLGMQVRTCLRCGQAL
jgi:hypothetical protein